MGGWSTNLSAGFISYPVQPTGVFVGQTYYNSTTDIAYVFDGTSWVMLSGTIGGLIYIGTWNASTNTPTLGNGGAGGVKGDYYVVSVAGTTSIDGVNDWEVGDWIVNNGTIWEKVDNSELPTIYTGNGTVGTNRVLTLTDTIRTDSVIGTMTTQYGIGVDPIAFGYNGALSYMFATPSVAVEAWGGVLNLSGNPAWWHEVYNPAGNTAGTFIGYSIPQTNPYSSLYHFNVAGGTYRGFEANNIGEQLYSQRLGLVTTTLTATDRVMFLGAGGYIRATTYANLVTQLAIPTLYSANGTIAVARVVTITGTLNFLTTTNGVAIGSAFTTANALEVRAFSATRSTVIQGFNTTTNSSLVVRNSTTNLADFQNIGNIVLANGATTHRVNIGGAVGTARLTVQGSGATLATTAFSIINSSSIASMTVRDDNTTVMNGHVAIGSGSATSTISILNISETSTVAGTFAGQQISLTIAPAVAGVYTSIGSQKSVSISGVLFSAGSTITAERNYLLGTGIFGSALLDLIATDNTVFNVAGSTSTIKDIYGNKTTIGAPLFGAGTMTVVNAYNYHVTDGSAGFSATNVYGLYIESLTRGTNNYGIVSLTARNGFGTITPNVSSILDLTSTTKGFLAPRMTSAQRIAIVTPATGLLVYQTDAPAGFYYFDGAVWVYLITPVTLYSGNGTVGTNRVATITDTLAFIGGRFSIGGSADALTRLTIIGTGITSATTTQIWKNSAGSELMRFLDSGVLCVGISSEASGLGTAQKMNIFATVTTDYSPTVIIDQTYSQSANNSNTSQGLTTRLYKASAFNTLEMFGAVNQVRNDGSGNISTMAGHQAFVWNVATATGTYGEAFAYNARTQTQQGTFTNLGGIVIQQQELANTTALNLISIYVKSPVNVGGVNVITNTYGVLLETNSNGTNNYGVYQNGANSRNYFNGNVSIGSSLALSTTQFQVRGTGSTIATITLDLKDSSNTSHFIVGDSGQTSSGAGTGAPALWSIFGNYWNASGFSEAGWGFYGSNCGKVQSVQMIGSTQVGIAIATQGSPTGTVMGVNSFLFSTLATVNIGLYGSARNGISEAIGVLGEIGGGASVTSSVGVSAVQGLSHADVDVHQWGGKFSAYQDSSSVVYVAKDFIGVLGNALGSTNAGSSTRPIGGKFTAISNVGSATAYGLWAEASGSGANYALVTNGGNIGFGTTTPSAQALLELVSTNQALLIMRMTSAQASAITPANGMGLYVTDTDATFLTTGFWKYENGAWATW